jgi:uncharacterized membrane protein YbhN (UPF0104 family)
LVEVTRHRPNLGLFGLAIGLYVGGLILSYFRWRMLTRAIDLPLRVTDALRLGFIGALFNFVIPGAIAGVFIRAAFLCRERPDRKPQALASAVIDLLVGLLGLASLACVAGTLGWGSLEPRARRLVIAALIIAGVLVGLIVLAARPEGLRALARRKAHRPKTARALAELVVTGETYRRRPWIVLIGVLLGAGTHSLNVLAFQAVGRSLFSEVPGLADHFLIVPLVLFSTAVPLPFGALGVSEGVSQMLFRLAAYPGGGVAMMGFRVLQIVGALIGFAVYLANLAQVRELKARAEQMVEETDLETLKA